MEFDRKKFIKEVDAEFCRQYPNAKDSSIHGLFAEIELIVAISLEKYHQQYCPDNQDQNPVN